MKKIYKYLTLGLIAGHVLGFSACNTLDEPSTTESPKTYTMTVTASKGDDPTTRALGFGSDGKLNATWTAGDAVQVYHVFNPGTPSEMESTTPDGTLYAQSSGATTTLTGTFTSSYTPAAGDVLRLRFNDKPNYTNQEGTLDYIAANCDYATAEITVDAVDAVTGNVTAAGIAEFANQQAIVKFSLKHPDGTTPVAATSLTVKVGSTTYNVTPTTAASDIYIAIKKASNKTVSLKATDGADHYRYEKSGISFAVGQYYAIGVKMTSLNLSTLSSDFTALDGDVLTGTLDGDTQPYKISIADGATVTLSGVTINGTNSNSCMWAGITCLGDATIVLDEGTTNTVRGFYYAYPGIQPAAGKTLTIEGTGTLNASNNGSAAGIGSVDPVSCGDIHIKSGNITATGSGLNSGIGSGHYSSCGTITISGGNVTAYGGTSSAAIGCANGGSCGAILIEGGTVSATATHSSNSTCIGGNGIDSYCPSVTFTRGITRMTLTNANEISICDFISASDHIMADTHDIVNKRSNAVNWLFNYDSTFTGLFPNTSFSTGTWTIAP